MKILNEGILDDLVNAATTNPEHTRGYSTIENYIYPRTAEELYKGIVYQLRQNTRNKTLHDIIMPIFFPESGKSPDIAKLSELIYGRSDVYPKATLIAKYMQKLEDVVIDFISEDAADICKVAEKQYKNMDITPDQYFGTVLKTVNSYKYDIVDKLIAVYKEFVKEAKKSANTTSELPNTRRSTGNRRTSGVVDNEVEKAVNTAYDELTRRYGNIDKQDFARAFADFIVSDVSTSSLAQLMRLR